MRPVLLTAALIAAMATGAHAQTSTYSLLQPNSTTTVLPVWGKSGQVEALLLLEPTTPSKASKSVIGPANGLYSRSFGNGMRFTTGFDAGSAPGSLGLYCNSGTGPLTSLDALASHCRFGNTQFNGSNPGLKAQAGVQRGNTRFGLSAGVATQALPQARAAGLPTGFDAIGSSFGSTGIEAASRVNNQYLGLNGGMKLGDQGWVSIGGTVAKARLIPSSQFNGKLPSEWNTGSISISGGRGSIGGEVIGTVVEIPGQSEAFRSVGAGVTWRTPWRAKVSVGADNLMTRGKNPLDGSAGARTRTSPENEIDGAVPFVRYEQDL